MDEMMDESKIEVLIGEVGDEVSEIQISLVNTERSDTFMHQGGQVLTFETRDIPQMVAVLQKAYRKFCSIQARRVMMANN